MHPDFNSDMQEADLKRGNSMQKILVSDITIKQPAAEGGFSLSFREKIELAKQLDKLGVSVIETGPIVNRRTDSLLIKSISSTVKDSTVAVPLVFGDEDSLDVTWNALREAAHPRIQVTAPVSTVQMEYLCHMKAPAVLERVKTLVKAAKAVCSEVEFVAEDAGRSEADFLREVLISAAEAGAGIITVCDTAGTLLPYECYDYIKNIRSYLPEDVRLGICCSNELSLADANAVAAIRAGAGEVKTAAAGDFTTSLEKLVHIIKIRGGELDADCSVRDTEVRRGVNQIRWMCETNRSKMSPFDNGVRDEHNDLELNIHDDMAAVLKAVSRLGYELSEDDGVKVFEAFRNIAEKKDSVTAKELDAIVASAAMQVPPTYRLENFVINSGNAITATSHIRMWKGENLMDGLAVGDGPIDASFLAIEQIVGTHYELDDFQIQAVTEGREAMGETVVRLRSDGKVYSGRGISTDVIGSSIQAYVSAVNKIVYEEGQEL